MRFSCSPETDSERGLRIRPLVFTYNRLKWGETVGQIEQNSQRWNQPGWSWVPPFIFVVCKGAAAVSINFKCGFDSERAKMTTVLVQRPNPHPHRGLQNTLQSRGGAFFPSLVIHWGRGRRLQLSRLN